MFSKTCYYFQKSWSWVTFFPEYYHLFSWLQDSRKFQNFPYFCQIFSLYHFSWSFISDDSTWWQCFQKFVITSERVDLGSATDIHINSTSLAEVVHNNIGCFCSSFYSSFFCSRKQCCTSLRSKRFARVRRESRKKSSYFHAITRLEMRANRTTRALKWYFVTQIISTEAHMRTPRYGQYLTHAHNHITPAVQPRQSLVKAPVCVKRPIKMRV